MRTMLWHNEGRICLLVQTEMNPTNQEWLSYMNAFSAHPVLERRTIVYTRGGSPNGMQRKDLEAFFRHGPKMPTVVITQSAVVRAVGAIVQFFNPRLRMFAPSDEQRAFDYLCLTAAEQQRVRSLRVKLETEIDVAADAA